MISLEENKAIIRKAIEALNKQDLSILDDLFSPNYIVHAYQIRDLEEFKQYYTRLYEGFPDWHESIEDIIAEKNKVWIRLTFTGTHNGEYRGLTPNGKKHTVVGVNIYRISEGKIVEAWIVEDTLESLKQIGAIEYTEKGKKHLKSKELLDYIHPWCGKIFKIERQFWDFAAEPDRCCFECTKGTKICEVAEKHWM